MRPLSAVAAFAILAITLFAASPSGAAASSRRTTPTPAATSTPSPTPTATPNPSVPPVTPAGTSLQDDARICWTDSSDNEDGFEIGVGFCDRSFTFTVGANVTCFDLPPEARRSAFPEDCFGAYQFWVSAFNDAGRSFPQVQSIPVRKGTPPTATPGAPAALPGTGARPAGHGATDGVLLLAAGSLLVLSGGLAVMINGRRRA